MEPVTCTCGKPEGSFACKLKHITFHSDTVGERAVDLSSELNAEREDATIPLTEGFAIAREARAKKATSAAT